MSNTHKSFRGPLSGLRILELASIGPGPYCAMLLSDLGAEVVRIDRAGGNGWPIRSSTVVVPYWRSTFDPRRAGASA